MGEKGLITRIGSDKGGYWKINQDNLTEDIELENNVIENFESSQKSSQKILTLILNNPQITTQEIADELGISRRAVAKQIANMGEKGLITRIGPNKGGYWQVVDNKID